MQSSVIMTSQPWGLGLEEKLLPEKLRDLNYKTHLVGKVSKNSDAEFLWFCLLTENPFSLYALQLAIEIISLCEMIRF